MEIAIIVFLIVAAIGVLISHVKKACCCCCGCGCSGCKSKRDVYFNGETQCK